MASTALLTKILYWHLVPSISTVILTAGFISLVARVFNVRSPHWQYWLFFVPLIKGFVVLTNGIRPPPAVPTNVPFVLGISIWDPLNMISVPSAIGALVTVSTVADQMIIGVICLLALVLVWRWVSLFAFYRSVRGEELHAEDAPHLFRVLDTLVDRMCTRYPRVTISDKPYILPCLVGVFKPTIILSPALAEESSDDILEAILAHELAHLKRRDNLLHWVSVILRDLLIVNPFAHLVFSKIMIAKEQDCDGIAADVTGKPKAIAEAIVYAATVTSGKGTKPLPGYMSGVGESISAGKLISRRLDMLLPSTSARKQKVHWAKGSIVAILALFSFFLHVWVTAPYPLLSPFLQF